MKSFVFLIGTVLGLSQSSMASISCQAGTLDSYIALGAGGCTVGSSTFSSFQILSGITGASPIAPAGITVTPLGSAGNPGLMFETSMTAPAGSLLESLFTYRLAGGNFISDAIGVSGASTVGDGAVTYIHDFCQGGAFGPDGVSGCTGTPGELLIFGTGTDQASYAPASFLNVADDFTLDGGLAGSASGGTFTDQFNTTTPEPSLLLSLGLGMGILSFCKFRAARQVRKASNGIN